MLSKINDKREWGKKIFSLLKNEVKKTRSKEKYRVSDRE